MEIHLLPKDLFLGNLIKFLEGPADTSISSTFAKKNDYVSFLRRIREESPPAGKKETEI
jgi:hypothetical protein